MTNRVCQTHPVLEFSSNRFVKTTVPENTPPSVLQLVLSQETKVNVPTVPPRRSPFSGDKERWPDELTVMLCLRPRVVPFTKSSRSVNVVIENTTSKSSAAVVKTEEHAKYVWLGLSHALSWCVPVLAVLHSYWTSVWLPTHNILDSYIEVILFWPNSYFCFKEEVLFTENPIVLELIFLCRQPYSDIILPWVCMDFIFPSIIPLMS